MVFKRNRIETAAVVVLLAFLVFRSRDFFPYPLDFVLDTTALVARLALLSMAFLGWGALLHRTLAGAERRISPAAGWALGAATTATVMGYLAPLWYPNILFLAPWAVAGIALLVRFRSKFEVGVRFERKALWLLAPFGVCALLLALAPPQSLDSLVYHLAIPKQFALQGRAFEMPWNLHSYFPQHAELLFGATLELDPTGILAQLLHLCAAVLTLTVVTKVGTREFGAAAGGLAAVILFSIPTYCLIAGWAWNDWFVLLYAALALDELLQLNRSDNKGGYLLAAAHLGSAAAVKYNALPLLALLAVGLARQTRRKLPAAALIVLILVAPWYGKNLLQTGNPVFPLLSNAHGADTLTEYRGETGQLDRWLGYLGRRDMIDESVGLLWIVTLPLGLGVLIGGRRRLWPLGAVAALYLAAAAVFHPTVRAFGPLFLVGSWLGGQGIVRLATSRLGKGLVLFGTILLLWINLAQVLWVMRFYDPFEVSLGFASRESYLETGHDYYSAYQWIADHTGPQDVVLVVGESRIFYLDRPAIAGSYLDQPVLSGFSRQGDAGSVAEALRTAGVTHILLNRKQLRVAARRPPTTNELLFFLDPRTESLLRELLESRTRAVFQTGPVEVYELLPGPAAKASP